MSKNRYPNVLAIISVVIACIPILILLFSLQDPSVLFPFLILPIIGLPLAIIALSVGATKPLSILAIVLNSVEIIGIILVVILFVLAWSSFTF